MIFSNSPVKTVQEKVNPFSKKNKLSSLKFERKKDYKTFIKFIKDNTKELEQIKIDNKEKKLKRGLVAGGIVGGALLLSLFSGGDDDSETREQANKINNFNLVAEKAKADARKDLKQAKESGKISKTSMLGTVGSSLKKVGLFVKNKAKRFIKTRQRIKNTARIKKNIRIRQQNSKLNFQRQKFKFKGAQKDLVEGVSKEIGGDTNINKKSTTATRARMTDSGDPMNIEQRQFANRNRLGFKDDKFTDLDFKKLQSDQGAEELIKDAKKIRLQDKLKIKSDIRLDRQEKSQRASNVLDDLEAESKRRAAIEDAEIKKTKSKIDKNKFFQAPEIPSNKTKKLNNFDKFNRFSSRILNSPAAKFATFMGGLFSSPKLQIIKTLMEPTPLADGTLEGKPVNIFLNNNQSMIPFNPDLKLNNGVIPPTDFPTPSSNVFIDPKQQLNIDDLFFLRSFSGG